MTDGAADPRADDVRSSLRRRRRWGLRLLGFLALAMVSMITAQAMGGYTIGSLGSLLFGIIGAAYCTVQGLREVREQGVWRLLTKGGGQNRR